MRSFNVLRCCIWAVRRSFFALGLPVAAARRLAQSTRSVGDVPCNTRRSRAPWLVASPDGDAHLTPALRLEEARQQPGRLLGDLFREEVTGIDCKSLDLVRPRPPNAQWPTSLRVPGVEAAASAPEREDGTPDAAPGFPVRGVVFPIARCTGAILLANRVYVRGILEHADI